MIAKREITVPDPDVPNPEIREGAVSKTSFPPLQASFWSKNKGWGGGTPRAPPLYPPLNYKYF